MKKLLPIIISILVLTLTASAFAQAVRTITVIPPTIDQKLNPGQNASGTLKVINQTDQPVTFKATVQDYIVDNNNGVPHILPPDTLSGKFSGSSWIGVYPSTFTLNAGDKQELSYYVQIPADARPGGHYAAVIYTPVLSPSQQASGASVNAQVGTLFYLTINGPITESANVTKFFTDFLHEFGPINIKTTIQNHGDLHIKPIGAIVLYDIFGKKSQVVGLSENNIFPGGVSRDYSNYVGQGFMIGPYTAKLLASYGVNNNLPLSASISFFVFPWRLFILIVLVIVASVLGYKYYQKRKKGEGKKEEEHTPHSPEGPTIVRN